MVGNVNNLKIIMSSKFYYLCFNFLCSFFDNECIGLFRIMMMGFLCNVIKVIIFFFLMKYYID